MGNEPRQVLRQIMWQLHKAINTPFTRDVEQKRWYIFRGTIYSQKEEHLGICRISKRPLR